MNFFKRYKINWKYILILVILAAIFCGGALWYTKRLVSFEQLSTCDIDSDCILVSHKSCGGMIKISINKKYESLYNSTPKFQDSTGEICKTRGISYDEQKQIIECQIPVESSCLNGRCRPKYVEETANWKTYRNEELGFEIKYPSEISAGQVKCFPEEAGAMLDRCYIDFSFPEIFFSDKKSRAVFISSWTKFTKNFPREINSLQELIDFYKKTIPGEYRYGHDLIEETVELDGVPAKKISYSKFSYPEDIKILVVWVFFQHKERMYLIEGDTDFESKNKYLSVFNQMLSTFRFLE